MNLLDKALSINGYSEEFLAKRERAIEIDKILKKKKLLPEYRENLKIERVALLNSIMPEWRKKRKML